MARQLNTLDDVLAAFRAREFDDREATRLPTFGGSEPSGGTSGIWSWDATRLLVGTCARDARIVDRAAYELGRRGGAATTAAKRAAARVNGAKGGRPRRMP